MANECDMLNDRVVLITGGTGSFGKAFARKVLESCSPKKVIVFSRDEFKQWQMRDEFQEYEGKMRFFIGDVRDAARLDRAFDGVDYVVHAAAMKQVPACEYNPFEAVKTNIHGAQNVIDAAIDRGVKKVVALSTDKAVNPVNLYGGTKLVSDKLFVAANAYAGAKDTSFSIVRYGNVSGSRGSVIPFFRSLAQRGVTRLPVTDRRMTRFWITLDEGAALVLKALRESRGGETFLSKIPSYRVTDLARAILPGCGIDEVGMREGEKLHEVMITPEDSASTYEFQEHYVIYPHMNWFDPNKYDLRSGRKVPDRFTYSSDTNARWLGEEELRVRLSSV